MPCKLLASPRRLKATMRNWLSRSFNLGRERKLNKARIAAREGISRARVTQVMNLLQLSAAIQADLLKPPAPLEIHSFSERRLRVLVSCGDEETQTSRWRELVQELRGSAGN
jgi:hypothetical protein